MSDIVISTPQEFINTFNSSSAIGSSSDYAHITLANDIDFSGYLQNNSITSWRIAGDYNDYYTFDGRGYSIKNLVVILGNTPLQFMLTRVDGYIRNLKFENCHFTTAYASSTWSFIAGYYTNSAVTDTNSCLDNIIFKGNCSFTNTNALDTESNRRFAVIYSDCRQNVPKKIINRIGISGSLRSGLCVGVYINACGELRNCYMHANVECYTGCLLYPVNNYEAKVGINLWNRSTFNAVNWFGGIHGWQSSSIMIYCYSDIKNAGGNPRYGIAPISNSLNNIYECLYYADYTVADGRGTAVTEAQLQDISCLRGRGWLI